MSFDIPEISNSEKEEVWQAFREGTPTRVPVILGTNPRIILLDPALNKRGHTFEDIFDDPQKMMEAALDHEYHRRTVMNRYCDSPMGLPDEWTAGINWQNIYEAAFFGAEINFREGQVPDTEPFLTGDNRDAVFDTDIENPLAHGIFKKGLDFHAAMAGLAENMEFHGRPVKIGRYSQTGSDGPLTVAMNIRGQDILTDLVLDPEYARKLMSFITEAAVKRVYAFREHWEDDDIEAGMADDSIQMLSTDMYMECIFPHHQRFFDEFMPDSPRGIHLCGDVQRHMPTLRDELNVMSFDTGFPIDFKALREEIGPDVHINGGPHIGLLLKGTAQEVYDETCRILTSGIMAGGHFTLREANNLPPCVPEANLAAMYRAALEKGVY